MKRSIHLLITLIFLCLASCQDPAKSRAYMDEGEKLMMRYSKYEEAEEAFTKAIKYDKNNCEAYYLRGCSKVNSKKYADAIADFEDATRLKPDYADAYYLMGKTYFLMNQHDKACENYKLAAKYGRPNMDDYLKRCQ